MLTNFLGGLSSSTPKPFGMKENSFKFPETKETSDICNGKEAMEVDENGKEVKNNGKKYFYFFWVFLKKPLNTLQFIKPLK